MFCFKIVLFSTLLLSTLQQTEYDGIDDTESGIKDFEFAGPSDTRSLDYYDAQPDSIAKMNFEIDQSINDAADDFENSKHPFNIKEKLLRAILTKALINGKLRRKFVEVIPILRVLSKPQRLALAALISAQINAKSGTELKLEQVRSMFGDSKKLILPLVFDIANLVRSASKNTQLYRYDMYAEKLPVPQEATNLLRRNFDITSPAEEDDDNRYEGIVDAKMINHALYADVRDGQRYNSSKEMPSTDFEFSESSQRRRRIKRSAYTQSLNQQQPSLVEKLAQFIPIFQQPSQRRSINAVNEHTFHERKLNMTNFIGPDDDQMALPSDQLPEDPTVIVKPNSNYSITSEHAQLSYEQIEDLAFVDLNGTEIGKQVENGNETVIRNHDEGDNTFPVAEALVGPRYRVAYNTGNILGSGHRKGPPRLPPRPKKPALNYLKTCERFTTSMCIRANDYPMEQIMGSIRRHKYAMVALLAEYRDKSAELEHQEYLEELELAKKRREDNNNITPGGMCNSVIRYARPQKARSASGEWKYIVNTGEHTQTLRLEKCSSPQESCSYLSENYRSRCLQVYNYHRLLSWDKTRGLHVDIFKVPTCCSCHVDGYRETFPPYGKQKDYTPATSVFKNNPFGAYSVEEDEEEPEDDLDNYETLATQYSNGFTRVNPAYKFENGIAHSGTSIKTNYEKPGTKKTGGSSLSHLGAYLSPPTNGYDSPFTYKRSTAAPPSYQPSEYYGPITRNRHQHSSKDIFATGDDRIDQTVVGGDAGKEVKLFPSVVVTDRPTLRPKRKRYHSSVSTAITTAAPTKFSTKSSFRTSSAFLPTIKTTGPFFSGSSTTALDTTTSITPKTTINTKTILNTKLTNSVKFDQNHKRVNYDYHPIIEFFDEDQNPPLSSSPSASSTSSPTLIRKKPNRGNVNSRRRNPAAKDSRIGFGDTATASTGGNNMWTPIVA